MQRSPWDMTMTKNRKKSKNGEEERGDLHKMSIHDYLNKALVKLIIDIHKGIRELKMFFYFPFKLANIINKFHIEIGVNFFISFCNRIPNVFFICFGFSSKGYCFLS